MECERKRESVAPEKRKHRGDSQWSRFKTRKGKEMKKRPYRVSILRTFPVCWKLSVMAQW